MTKSELRQHMIKERLNLSDELIQIKSKTIISRIRMDQRYKKANTVALFYPMKKEVHLLELLQDSTTFLFPRVEKDGIHFYPADLTTDFIKSPFGVMEPKKTIHMDESIEYMLVPALAISSDYYRIGYGRAYYDRFLIKHRPQTVVGVIFDFQKISSFQHDDHDQKVDDVIEG